MTDGTSQGLFIVVAIVIFGIFVVLAYILFEDTLSPALASMFTDATEKSALRLSDGVDYKTIYNQVGFTGKSSELVHFQTVRGAKIVVDKDDPIGWYGGEHALRLDYTANTDSEIRFLLQKEKIKDLEVGDKIVLHVTTKAHEPYGTGDVFTSLGGSLTSDEHVHRPVYKANPERIELTIDSKIDGDAYISIKMIDKNIVLWTGQWTVEKHYK